MFSMSLSSGERGARYFVADRGGGDSARRGFLADVEVLGDDAWFDCLRDSVDLVREPSDAVLVSWTRRLHADDGVVVVVEAEGGDALAMADESVVQGQDGIMVITEWPSKDGVPYTKSQGLRQTVINVAPENKVSRKGGMESASWALGRRVAL